ncbi:unnamed protein product [Litomosoides sigmodontis]|uniref:Uncharacterized protein n=1 Tax=Litomosoides sigmodontis TaxID=42156 RepID=A0A3P6U0H8_LITSI|nr:unnamed protein product [Litomosoides sigmodontis]
MWDMSSLLSKYGSNFSKALSLVVSEGNKLTDKQRKRAGFANRTRKKKLRNDKTIANKGEPIPEMENTLQPLEKIEENVSAKALKRKREQSTKGEKYSSNQQKVLAGKIRKSNVVEEVDKSAKKLKSEKMPLFENDGDADNEDLYNLNSASENSDNDVESDCFSSSDPSESDADDLPIERKCRRLERKKENDEKLADDELLLNIESGEKYKLPSIEEVEDEMKQTPNLKIIKQRILDIFQVLGDFKTRRDPSRTLKLIK